MEATPLGSPESRPTGLGVLTYGVEQADDRTAPRPRAAAAEAPSFPLRLRVGLKCRQGRPARSKGESRRRDRMRRLLAISGVLVALAVPVSAQAATTVQTMTFDTTFA